LIHASQGRSSYFRVRNFWPERYPGELPAWEDLTKGAVLGVVDLVDCLKIGDPKLPASPWVEGPWCFVLAYPRPFATPIPFSGALNLFEVSDHYLPAY
jgi:hypothetical protein